MIIQRYNFYPHEKNHFAKCEDKNPLLRNLYGTMNPDVTIAAAGCPTGVPHGGSGRAGSAR